LLFFAGPAFYLSFIAVIFFLLCKIHLPLPLRLTPIKPPTPQPKAPADGCPHARTTYSRADQATCRSSAEGADPCTFLTRGQRSTSATCHQYRARQKKH